MNVRATFPILALLAAFCSGNAFAETSFAQCLAKLRNEATSRGVAGTTFEAHTATLEADMTVVAKLDYQPEFRVPIWDYFAGLVDDERIADGRAMLRDWAPTLAAIAGRYGVDPETIVAVWGIESNFGRNFGNRPLLSSLATLSCFGRRQSYFRGEFFTTLRILQEGHVDAERLTGSWAGAFGHTQFMPSTFMRVAVDFDGDGRRDLIGSVPDALASTANFLVEAGWQSDRVWGYEVSLPAGFDVTDAGRRNKRPLGEWAALGIQRADGKPIEEMNEPTALLLPAGQDGPAFIVTRNFDAIFSYNASESYALAIAHLSDRLRGTGPFVTPWPTDDPGLSRAERREVQTLLAGLGYDIGEIDGAIGDITRRAIVAYQASKALEPDGRAGRKLLEALRGESPSEIMPAQ